MAEHSAIEILAAQLEHEVIEAKAAIEDLFGNGTSDALETLIDRCVKRWWLTRMLQKPKASLSNEEMTSRRDSRLKAFKLCTNTIVEKSGPIDPTSLQIGYLGMSAELNALWTLLIEAGLVTQDARHDYMDLATAELYQRVHANAQKILTPGANGFGSKPS